MATDKNKKEDLLNKLKAHAFDLLRRRGKLLQEVTAIDKMLAEVNSKIEELEAELEKEKEDDNQ